MELELKKACFDAYEAAGELTLTQEETAETIVPDYCPDIARIIETTGKVFLHSREMRDGRAEISGTIRVTAGELFPKAGEFQRRGVISQIIGSGVEVTEERQFLGLAQQSCGVEV